MNKIKTIIITHIPLPYSKIGSWTTLYDNFLKQSKSIDLLICPEPEEKYSHIAYECFITDSSWLQRILQKIKLKLPWHKAVSSLKRVIQPETKYIIQIIDNYGLCIAIANYLEKENIRDNFYIQYFYHGYPSFKNELIYSKIDELILLTHKSYQEIKKNVSTFPCRVSILHNGIDTSKFCTVSNAEKQIIRKKFKIDEKKIFLWCSQDRSKKGLHIILDVWRTLSKNHKNIELWIIGTAKKQNTQSIKYIGKVPNNDLPKYYQASNVFLFPTLCQEGFGLSLIEALHCGNYCIASALGGVPEVLEYGKYGKLIEKPNFIDEWILAIEDYLKGNCESFLFPKELYTKEAWNLGMESCIIKAKNSMYE